jgi:MFS family permease
MVTTRTPYFGWRVVWAAFTIAIFAWGIGFYGPGIFLEALQDRHGWSISLISAAITTHFLLGALLVARFPAVEARLGIMRVVLLGAGLTAIGLIGWSSATQPWQIFAAAAFSGAGWALTSGASINAMVSRWFDGRRPAAIALAFNGASMGGVIFAPLWALLIHHWGFPLAGGVIAGATLLVMAALALLMLRHTPQSLGQTPDPPAPRAAGALLASSLPPGRAIWREPRFLRLCVGFSLGAAALVGLLAHLFSLLSPTLGTFGAGLALSLITISAVIGRTALGYALPVGADRRRAGAWNFALQTLGTLILLMALDVSASWLLFGCVVVGLTVGNMLSLPPMIAQSEFTRADVGRVVALVTAVNQATYALTPGGFGLLRDFTGSGAAVLVAAALLQAISAVILFRR